MRSRQRVQEPNNGSPTTVTRRTPVHTSKEHRGGQEEAQQEERQAHAAAAPHQGGRRRLGRRRGHLPLSSAAAAGLALRRHTLLCIGMYRWPRHAASLLACGTRVLNDAGGKRERPLLSLLLLLPVVQERNRRRRDALWVCDVRVGSKQRRQFEDGLLRSGRGGGHSKGSEALVLDRGRVRTKHRRAMHGGNDDGRGLARFVIM